MVLILWNFTKFLLRCLPKSVVYFRSNRWKSHMCGMFKVVLTGQLVVFSNYQESRNYFRLEDLRKSELAYVEGPVPNLLYQIGVSVERVFAQLTDQWGYLNGTHFDWSPRGLFKVRGGCYEYETALDHRIKESNKKNKRTTQGIPVSCSWGINHIGGSSF